MLLSHSPRCRLKAWYPIIVCVNLYYVILFFPDSVLI